MLIAAIACGVGAMAQDSRVATLQHGANFRTYYGTDALKNAHNDASDGDVITLSAGEFDTGNISKAITIRGAGMKLTSIKTGGDPLYCNMSQGSRYTLCFEGLSICVITDWHRNANWGDIGFNGNGSGTIVLSKCGIKGTYGTTTFSKCNAIVMQSYVEKPTSSASSNVTFINSILNVSSRGNGYNMQNCVIIQTPNVTNSSIKNSIVYAKCSLDNTNVTSHCLVKEGSNGFADSWYIKTEQPEPDPWGENPTYTLFDELFTEDYHLTEEAAATYIGTDGTEVGVYGGAYPYDETPDYPLVKNLEVKGIHEEGKLTVKINVE